MTASHEGPEAELLLKKERHFLSDKKFQKHLESLSPDERDELDVTDEEALEEEYKLFTSTENVREGLGRMWPSHMEEAFGIRLGKEGKEAVNAYLRKEMRENPEKIQEFAEKLETFRVNREKIRKLEATLEAHRAAAADASARSAGLAKLAARQNSKVQQAGLLSKWFGKNHRKNKEEFEKTNSAAISQSEAARAAEEAASIAAANLDALRTDHETGRDGVVKELLQEEALAALVRSKVEKKLEKDLRVGGPKDFRAIEGASALGKKYREFAEDADAEDTMGVDDVADKLDDLAEKRARAEVKKAIRGIKVGYRYEKLQEKLSAFVNLNPIGSKEHEDAQDFVMEVFEEEVERLQTAAGTDPKAVLQLAMVGVLRNQVAMHYEEATA